MPTDWYERGCHHSCAQRHTYAPGACALAPESADTELAVGVFKVRRVGNTFMCDEYAEFTAQELAELIKPVLQDAPGDPAEAALAVARAIVYRTPK